MASKRTYGDACRFAHALDLIGERWALLVVRELLLGPKRFTDLRSGLPKASTNILAGCLHPRPHPCTSSPTGAGSWSLSSPVWEHGARAPPWHPTRRRSAPIRSS